LYYYAKLSIVDSQKWGVTGKRSSLVLRRIISLTNWTIWHVSIVIMHVSPLN